MNEGNHLPQLNNNSHTSMQLHDVTPGTGTRYGSRSRSPDISALAHKQATCASGHLVHVE